MKDLKSFSVGHTAKGAIWWQAWPFDGEPRKGTAETIGGALDAIGIAAPTTAEVAAVSREYSDLCAERADDREQVKRALEAKDAEIARLTAHVASLSNAIARMEALLPDSYNGADPAPQAADKAPSSPVAPRKPVKASKGPSAVQDGPMADADPVGAYLTEVRRG